MKVKLIVIFLISFVTISSQNMLSYEMGLPEVELNISKPQNKFVARKQANNKALVFIYFHIFYLN